MKSIFKSILKITLIAGLSSLATCFFLFFAFFGVIGMLANRSENGTRYLKDNTVLVMKTDLAIEDRVGKSPFADIEIEGLRISKKIGLLEWQKGIKRAAADPKIKAIYLENEGPIEVGLAVTEEVRNTLGAFKSSGKPIYCYGNRFTQKAYYLASICSKIYLNPQGELEWKGLRAEVLFFKSLLDKLEIEPILVRHGKYKAAGETFVQDRMSSEYREETLSFLKSVWKHWVAGISQARKIEVEKLNALADQLEIRNAKSALDAQMIDGIEYRDQVIDRLKKLTQIPDGEELRTIQFLDYEKRGSEEKLALKSSPDKIALLYLSGGISDGSKQDGGIAGSATGEQIRKIKLEKGVKALVIRIDSPGGSALASEVIWREVELAKKKFPVVVSMGDVAASGGYYIAAPADAIFANPTTVTGSIGVFGLVFNMKNGMKNKLGITVDGAKTHAYSDAGSSFRSPLPLEKKVALEGVEEVYQAFLGHVATGRKLDLDEVDKLAQGRIWTGLQAKESHLIDEVGGLEQALAFAAKKAKLKDYRLVEFPKAKGPFHEILEELSDFRTRLKTFEFPLEVRAVQQRLQEQLRSFLVHCSGPLVLLPFSIDLK